MIDQRSAGLDPKSREARLYRVAEALVAAWRAEAREHGFKRTLPLYIRSIGVRRVTPQRATISLAGDLPVKLELGWAPHDMRDYLLKTRRPGASRIRRVKKGKRKGEPYRFIMFRRTAAEIKQFEGAPGYKIAKSLAPSTSSTEGRLIYGSLYSGATRHYLNKSGVRSVSPALEGMARLEGGASTASNQGSRSTYAAWRTISTLRPEAWQHPGLRPAMLHRKIIANAAAIAEAAGV